MKVRSRIVAATMAAATVSSLMAGFVEYATAHIDDGALHVARNWRGADAGVPELRLVIHQLDLSDAQRAAIRQLLAEARATTRATGNDPRPDLHALLVPTDPNHAAAVTAVRQHESQRVERRVVTDARIYALLTAEQRAKLPQLLEQAMQQTG